MICSGVGTSAGLRTSTDGATAGNNAPTHALSSPQRSAHSVTRETAAPTRRESLATARMAGGELELKWQLSRTHRRGQLKEQVQRRTMQTPSAALRIVWRRDKSPNLCERCWLCDRPSCARSTPQPTCVVSRGVAAGVALVVARQPPLPVLLCSRSRRRKRALCDCRGACVAASLTVRACCDVQRCVERPPIKVFFGSQTGASR
jgi:hypothetical protein